MTTKQGLYQGLVSTMTEPTTTPKRRRRWLQSSLLSAFVVTAIALVAGTLVSAVRSARDTANRITCQGRRIQMIGMALQQYHGRFGCFPPAYVADRNGQPMHSWRVLILPYLECHDLYSRYDFAEPWDGPKNRLLRTEMPDVYRCPCYRGQKASATNYVAVVDPTTAWPGDRALAVSEIADGTSHTVLLVEIDDSDITWTEPRDMSLAQATDGVNVDRQHGISSNHADGAMVGLADGSSFALPNDADPEAIKAWLTINGKESRAVLSTARSRSR
jgi:hypothetical protein